MEASKGTTPSAQAGAETRGRGDLLTLGQTPVLSMEAKKGHPPVQAGAETRGRGDLLTLGQTPVLFMEANKGAAHLHRLALREGVG